MTFAREVLKMVEDMKRTCCGQPRLPSVVPPALETFKNMDWCENTELWEFAQLPQLFNYLRPNRVLKIPSEWKSVVPKSM